MLSGFRPVSESEVVLALLRGELESARFDAEARRAVRDAGGFDLVVKPNLDSVEENRAREQALGQYRGWRSTELFKDFPAHVEWFHGVLAPHDLERVRFIEYSYWNELSGGSRLARDVRSTIEAGTLPDWLKDLETSWCFELAEHLATTEAIDGLIVMATRDLTDLVLLEGHARLTALFVGELQRKLMLSAYVGLSDEITKWDGF